MVKFTVTLKKSCVETLELVIDAESQKDAEAKAEQLALDGCDDGDWETTEDTIDVERVMPV